MSDVKVKQILISSAAGVGTVMLTSIILSMISAALYLNGALPTTSIRWLGLAVNALSTLVGCLFAVRILGAKKVIICGVVIATYLLLKLIISLTLFDGTSDGVVYSMLAGLGGGITACLLKGKYKKTKRR